MTTLSSDSRPIPQPLPSEDYKFTPEEWDMFIVFLAHLAIGKNQNFLRLYSIDGEVNNENKKKLSNALKKAMRVIPSHSYYFI